MEDRTPKGRIDFGKWILTVLTWDGVLPAITLTLPVAINWLFPRGNEVIGWVAVAFPIVAFFVRIAVSGSQIVGNYCSPGMQWFQSFAFILALFVMMVIDAIVLTFASMKNIVGDSEFFLASACLMSVYLPLMIFAMYPGRTPVEACADQTE